MARVSLDPTLDPALTHKQSVTKTDGNKDKDGVHQLATDSANKAPSAAKDVSKVTSSSPAAKDVEEDVDIHIPKVCTVYDTLIFTFL